MSNTRFDSFINNHAQKILVKLQEKKSIENLLFDFLNEYNNNILANIFESATATGTALAAPRPAAPAPGAPRPAAPAGAATAPVAPRPAAPVAAKKIIDDNKEKFKTILKATVTNKVFEMGTELSKHFADEKKAGMAQNYYVVLKNIKEKLIKFLDNKDTFNENTSHNSFKNFLENNSNKFELSKLSSAVLFDPKNTQEYLHEYILKNNIIKESTSTTANVNYGNLEYFGTKEIQKNNLQLIFKNITKSIKDKIIEIQGKIQDKIRDKNEKTTIEKYFTNIQDKIIKELLNNILPTIYNDMKPVDHKDAEAKTKWKEAQQQKRYEAIINHSENLKKLFGLVKNSPKFRTVIGDIDQNQNLYGGLQSLAEKTNGKDTIIDIIEYNNYMVDIPFNLSKAELEAIFLGVLKESKSEFEIIYKDRLISHFSKNKSKSGIKMIDDYVLKQKDLKDTEFSDTLEALRFKYIKNGIKLNNVEKDYFDENDLICIFMFYDRDEYKDELDKGNFNDRPIIKLLKYYETQNYDTQNYYYKSAYNSANGLIAIDDIDDDDDDWDNLKISDEDSHGLDMMTPEQIAQELVKEGNVKLDEPLSKIKEMFAVDGGGQLLDDYLTELALYRMCIKHKGLQELTEDDLKIILVHDFPNTDYANHKRILTDEEVKSLPEIFNARGRYSNFVNAYRYLAHNKGNLKKMQSILEKNKNKKNN